MIDINDISLNFGQRILFDNASAHISDGQRVGLTGKNGSGKTTLFNIILGLNSHADGEVRITKGHRIASVAQQIPDGDISLIDYVLQSDTYRTYLLNELEQAENENNVEKLAEIHDQLNIIQAYSAEARAATILFGLGFSETDQQKPITDFSGGWRMRIELAKILLGKPDILLLDEPTNHLDIESIEWLESFLKRSESALLLVSHDKAFLDAVTTRTIEISLGQIFDYKANYSKYLELRAERREMQLRAYENQRKMIEDTEDFIERFRYKATKAVQVQSRIKQLEKLERIEVDEVDNQALRLKFPPAPHSGALPVDIEGLTKAYGNHVVLNNVDVQIKRGEKVAFVGKNGEGKSTLVKCIMGELPSTGGLKICQGVKIGYFAQNQASLLDETQTVFETIDNVAVGDIRTKIRAILGAFMFGGEASDKKVKVLSGGERSRLAMIKLLLEPVNLLILDEPTNHLDMMSKDVLKQAIKEFDGTAIIVSHDREFLDGLVSMVYEFGGGKVVPHIGGIYDFLQDKKIANLQELERNKVVQKPIQVPQKSNPDVKKEPQLSYEERKEQQRRQQKADKAVAEIERKITDKEAEIRALEEKMASSNIDNAIFTQYATLKKEIEALETEWMYLVKS